MKVFSHSIALELDRKLELIHLETEDPLAYAQPAVMAVVDILEKLKTFSIRYKFQSKAEEIGFFRETKPRFASRLVYYNEIYNIETSRPLGTPKALRRYYKAEMAKLRSFFDENLEFYRYYRKGSTFLDSRYFVRGRHDLRMVP